MNNENAQQNINYSNNIYYKGFAFQRKRVCKAHTTYWCKYTCTERCQVKLKVMNNGN